MIDFVQSLPLSELQLASLILMCLLLVLVPICVVSMTMFNKKYFVNVYVSNKVDAVYKVTVNDTVIPPVATSMEQALFNAYSYIYSKECAGVMMFTTRFKNHTELLFALRSMNVKINEAHIATNTGFGELYSNF